MHNKDQKHQILRRILLSNFLFLVFIAFADHAQCDIYRFVTIDGVETFTDAPSNKEARVFIKDSGKKKPASKKIKTSSKPPKVHNISLDEIVQQTVVASINPGESKPILEPRLPPVGGTITSGVGMRVDPIDGKLRHHNGIDIAIPEGTLVRPATSGVVVFSGHRPGYGYTVLVEHDNGMITLYGHNSRLTVSQGQVVDADTVIAYSGNTGRSTGPHLHFEAWQAGTNVTAAFMPGSPVGLPKIQLAAKRKSSFRRQVLADGSILFTNLPDSIP